MPMQRHSPDHLDVAATSAAPRHISIYVFVAFVGLALFWLPHVARADDLNWETDVTYSVDVDNGFLHVESELVLSNKKPNTQSGNTITQFFFDGIELQIPESVTNVSITTNGQDLDFSFDALEGEESEGFKTVAVEFARNLFFNQSTTILIEFDLAGEDPRSDTPFRINPAYVTFGAFSWGDPDQTTMRIVLPSTFDIEILGGSYASSSSKGLVVYTIDQFDNPDSGFVYIQARNDDVLTNSLASTEDYGVVVRAWPGDIIWETRN